MGADDRPAAASSQARLLSLAAGVCGAGAAAAGKLAGGAGLPLPVRLLGYAALFGVRGRGGAAGASALKRCLSGPRLHSCSSN